MMQFRYFRLPLWGIICLFLLTIHGFAQEATASEILAEVNLLRTQPQQYAQIIREDRKYISGMVITRPGQIGIRLKEGVAAVDEAIRFLEQQPAVPALQLSAGLSFGAADHVKDQGASGKTGHPGGDGSMANQRVQRYGTANGTGENLAYGFYKARDIVIQLVVDDGVPDRGHRTNFFRDNWHYMGTALGPHPTFRTMCAITFADNYVEDPARQTGRQMASSASSSRSTSPPPTRGSRTSGPMPGDPRGIAERCLQFGMNQDASGVRQCLTPEAKGRASLLSGRMAKDATNGITYRYLRSQQVGSSMVTITFHKQQGRQATPFTVTVLREGNIWLVDDISE